MLPIFFPFVYLELLFIKCLCFSIYTVIYCCCYCCLHCPISVYIPSFIVVVSVVFTVQFHPYCVHIFRSRFRISAWRQVVLPRFIVFFIPARETLETFLTVNQNRFLPNPPQSPIHSHPVTRHCVVNLCTMWQMYCHVPCS
jgi:hypothetical protein